MQTARTIEQWMRDQERNASPASRRVRALIPPRYHEMPWSDYKPDALAGEERLKDILRHYAEHWSPDVTEGIVLLGSPGFGKTAGMALLACDLIDAGAWVRWISFADLTRRKRELFKLARSAELADDWEEHEREELRIHWIEQDCDVLFLDDVGKEYRAQSGWSDAELENLLRTRTAAGKVTMISSNTPYEDWNTYNSSMASFLLEIGELVQLTDGKDHRLGVRPGSMRASRAKR